MPSENLFYTAKWTANANTKYLVEHYLEELDGSFTKQESDTAEKYGETDTLATVQTTDIKEYEHFTHATVSQSVESANINGNESTVLKVYYTRNEYTIRLVAGDNVTVKNSRNGKYKYGYTIDGVTASYNEGYLGYDWKGWHNGDDVLTYDNTIPSFTVDKDMDYTADFTVKPEMLNYNFTSNTTECTITGIKDKMVTEVIIPNYVTIIGSSAFSGCISLTYIMIPDSVISIGDNAFNACSSLLSITIPNNVISIGYYAFTNCSSLANVIFEDDSKLTIIEAGLFENCWSLTNITISDKIENIGSYAFYNCHCLVEVYNKSKLTITIGSTDNGYLGYYAKAVYTNPYNSRIATDSNGFMVYDESILLGYKGTDTAIVVPNNIIEIRGYAFHNCTSITSIVIPDSVYIIGESIFYDCSSLERVQVPFIGSNKYTTTASANTLFGYFFGSQSYSGGVETAQRPEGFVESSSRPVPKFYIPSSLRTVIVNGGDILYNAFQNCTNITSVVIGNRVTSIEGGAFSNCSCQIEWCDNPSLTELGGFNGYKGTSIIIPNSVTRIKGGAFHDSNLESINLPEGVTDIGDNAFSYCFNLTNITIPKSLISVGSNAFYNCHCLVEVYNKSELTITIGSSDNGYLGYYAKNIYTPLSGDSKLTNWNGYTIYNGEIIVGYNGIEKELTIPEGITEIYQYAFYNKNELMDITVSGSVISIGASAFENCSSLISVKLGAGLDRIEYNAFTGCSNLQSVKFYSSYKTTGWRITKEGGNYTILDSEVSDSSKAAIALRLLYKTYTWRRI